jgi:hypothetical protein
MKIPKQMNMTPKIAGVSGICLYINALKTTTNNKPKPAQIA